MQDSTPPLNVEDSLYGFETDHLALKGNEDYLEMLKTIVTLNAQRKQALRDYQKVAELRVQCLKDPYGTLKRIRSGDSLGVPSLVCPPKLPRIDFQKYKVSLPEGDLLEIYSEGQQPVPEQTELKPASNTKAWTPDEQKRLEELLQIYPPEPVELRRFQKIANALGNRTAVQVASRIQKYFLKLYKAGLPIPGRIPKGAEKHKKSALHKHQRHNHYLWKPSSFFPELNVPVQMEDINSIPGPSTSSNQETSVNYPPKNDYLKEVDNSEELKLQLLKKVKEIKLLEQSEDYIPYSHVGYVCDYCNDNPIVGSRWHCADCIESVDFCTDCVVSQVYTEAPHNFSHQLLIFQSDESYGTVLDGLLQGEGKFDREIREELNEASEEEESE